MSECVAKPWCFYPESYVNETDAYLFVYDHILFFFLWKETQFIEDLVHLGLPGQDYILNIYLLFTSFPSAL